MRRVIDVREHVSEVDPMSGKYPSNLLRRVSVAGIFRQIGAAIARTLQRAVDGEGSLIPIPVRRAVTARRGYDQRRPRD
jgi:hypothetical protein